MSARIFVADIAARLFPVKATKESRTPPSVHRTLARLAAASPVALSVASVTNTPGLASSDVARLVSIPSAAKPAALASSLLLSARYASVAVAASA